MNKNDNVNNSTHIVRVKDYYPMDCSGQEFMEISDELYNDLEKNKKTEETRKRVERRRIAKIRLQRSLSILRRHSVLVWTCRLMRTVKRISISLQTALKVRLWILTSLLSK